jgi:hypothetical protein
MRHISSSTGATAAVALFEDVRPVFPGDGVYELRVVPKAAPAVLITISGVRHQWVANKLMRRIADADGFLGIAALLEDLTAIAPGAAMTSSSRKVEGVEADAGSARKIRSAGADVPIEGAQIAPSFT